MANWLGEKPTDTDNLKDQIKEQKDKNSKNTQLLEEYDQVTQDFSSYADKISELDDLTN